MKLKYDGNDIYKQLHSTGNKFLNAIEISVQEAYQYICQWGNLEDKLNMSTQIPPKNVSSFWNLVMYQKF